MMVGSTVGVNEIVRATKAMIEQSNSEDCRLTSPMLDHKSDTTSNTADESLSSETSAAGNENENSDIIIIEEADEGISSGLASAGESDALFREASVVTVVMWLLLMLVVLLFVPSENYERLQGSEKDAAVTAVFCLAVSMVMIIVIPLGLLRHPNQATSGVVLAGITVMGISMATNACMAWLPTVVMVDPVTKARVYVFRWLEWTPLAYLMTILAEAVDVPLDEQYRKKHLQVAVWQTVAVACGLVFPFCYGLVDWCCWMTLSVSTYITIFPRVAMRRKRLNECLERHPNQAAMTVNDKELYDRLHFGYLLAMTCSCVWTLLVVQYCCNMFYHRMSENHQPPFPGAVMVFDTTYDVIAKALYMKFIMDVHRLVYDPAARTRRQLLELCRLVSVLWGSASDVIVVSVQVGNKTTAMLSPSFSQLMLDMTQEPSQYDYTTSNNRLALVIETDSTQLDLLGGEKVIDAYFVNADAIVAGNIQDLDRTAYASNRGGFPAPSNLLIEQGRKLSQATREFVFGVHHCESRGDGLVECILQKGREEDQRVYCEISASRHDGDSVIGVARNMTERHRRTQAERKALEAMVRQKEAQSINSFTRHEVKNGLLASIEVVEGMKRLFATNELYFPSSDAICGSDTPTADMPTGGTDKPTARTLARAITTDETSRRGLIVFPDANKADNSFAQARASKGLKRKASSGYDIQRSCRQRLDEDSANLNKQEANLMHFRMVKDLGEQLHRTLDTVLAETMARDVIYKQYLPRLEGCQIRDLLRASAELAEAKNNFPLEVIPECMPRLHLDPQLVRYIHRNAVSNAIKYGKKGGTVLTRSRYCPKEGNLTIEVLNEPGPGHEELVELSIEATEGVFSQGKRLHTQLLDDSNRFSENEAVGTTSTGDGAWIMQRCAMALNGGCTIKFQPDGTIFSVSFPVEQVSASDQHEREHFKIPPNTFGIAVDDSQIQRKLMGRILLNAGIEEKRIHVLGHDREECTNLASYLSSILVETPDAKILVLMDENLDFKDKDGKTVMLSGSRVASEALETLSAQRERQVLVLMRSANDSASDIGVYKRRTHGFFPKAPMHKERIREILAPLWAARFGS